MQAFIVKMENHWHQIVNVLSRLRVLRQNMPFFWTDHEDLVHGFKDITLHLFTTFLLEFPSTGLTHFSPESLQEIATSIESFARYMENVSDHFGYMVTDYPEGVPFTLEELPLINITIGEIEDVISCLQEIIRKLIDLA
jgi:hypothetical protein